MWTKIIFALCILNAIFMFIKPNNIGAGLGWTLLALLIWKKISKGEKI